MAESSFRRRLLLQDHNTFTVDTSVYLTFVALENDLTVTFSNELQYFINGNEDWDTLPANTESPSINAGQTISFKANIVPVKNNGANNGVGRFRVSKKFEAIGDPRSLSHGDVMEEIIHGDLGISDYQFYNLFGSCGELIKVSKNFLPSTKLANHCYSHMFDSCDGLTTTPELPATTLIEWCYESMFSGCTSLTIAPELPATTLANYCYFYMFRYCTSLTIAPELPVTELADYCYDSMFSTCYGLTTAPELPATTLAEGCYESMFSWCDRLKSVPELNFIEVGYGSCRRMFEGCSNLEIIPMELPAVHNIGYAYEGMFRYCDSMEISPAINNITIDGIFGSYNACQYMFEYCTNLKEIYLKGSTYATTDQFDSWVSGVSPTGKFYKLPSVSFPTGESGIPEGWEIVDSTWTAPDRFRRGVGVSKCKEWVIDYESSSYLEVSAELDYGFTVIRFHFNDVTSATFEIETNSAEGELLIGDKNRVCTPDQFAEVVNNSGTITVNSERGSFVEFCLTRTYTDGIIKTATIKIINLD